MRQQKTRVHKEHVPSSLRNPTTGKRITLWKRYHQKKTVKFTPSPRTSPKWNRLTKTQRKEFKRDHVKVLNDEGKLTWITRVNKREERINRGIGKIYGLISSVICEPEELVTT